MYVTTPFSRLIALDPETGKELWAFDPKLDRDRAYNLFINRRSRFLDRWEAETHSSWHAGRTALFDRRIERQAGR